MTHTPGFTALRRLLRQKDAVKRTDKDKQGESIKPVKATHTVSCKDNYMRVQGQD